MNRRLAADGTVSSFSIPSGKVLVLTGLEWARCLGAGNANLLTSARFRIAPAGTLDRPMGYALAGPNGCAGGTHTLSGPVVRAGSTACLEMASGDDAVLHGYLTEDQ